MKKLLTTLLCLVLLAQAVFPVWAEDGLELELDESILLMDGQTDNSGGMDVVIEDMDPSVLEDLEGVSLDGDLPNLDGGLTLDGEAGEVAATGASANAPKDFEIINGVLVRYTGDGGVVTIPDGVTAIAKGVFRGCDILTGIKIPDSVKTIAEEAFKNCYNLTSVTIRYGVTSIGQEAFYGCDSLTELTIPDSVGLIDKYAFTGCANLGTIKLPDSLGILSEGVFSECYNLSSIVIPDKIGLIENYAFDKCYGLADITILGDSTSIADWAFRDVPKTSTFHTICDTAATTWAQERGYKVYKSNHNAVTDPAVPATCTTAGKTEGSHCSVCGTIIVPQQETPLADHTPVTDPAVPATCTTAGKTEGSHCSVCGTIIVAQQETPLDDHTPVTDSGVPATCTKAGKTEGSHCSVCGTVITAQQTIPAKGHTPVTDPAVPATYTETGLTEGSHCAVCGKTLVEQQVVPKLGPTGVKLNKTKATLYAGLTLKLKATVQPTKAKTTLKWTSSNKKVATVTQNGVVKALKKGTATITVKTANGKKATCKITVPVAPTKVTLNKKNATLKVRKKLTLKATLTPVKAETTLTWTTSNKKIATVTQKGVVGVVTAMRPGKATITVKTANGKKATFVVTVTKQ